MPNDARTPPSVLRIGVYAVIFLTGASGLIYQVVWQRYMRFICGAEASSTALIIGAFLGFLALGYLLAGNISTRVKRPLVIYALFETIIASWGLAFPFFFSIADSLTTRWSFEPPFGLVLQGLTVATLLIGVPTTLMGATVPMMTRGLTKHFAEATRNHARIYALNTSGAFLGAIGAGFFLIETLGLIGTTYVAALFNFATAIVMYKAGCADGEIPMEENDESQPASAVPAQEFGGHSVLATYAVAFLNGFYIITLENVVIRIINISMGPTAYSFSLIVAVFILGLALGSWWVERFPSQRRLTLFRNQSLITFFLVAIYLSLPHWPYCAWYLRMAFGPTSHGMFLYYAFTFGALLIAVGIPVVFMGATIPIVFDRVKRSLRQVGFHSGWILFVNGIGCLTGSVIAGFALFYWFNLGSIFLLAAVAASSCAFLSLPRNCRALALGAIAVTIVLAVTALIDPARSDKLALGYYRQPFNQRGNVIGPQTLEEKAYRDLDVIFNEDGPVATVAVLENRNTKHKALLSNGRSESSTGGDTKTLSLSAHIPILFSDSPKSVLNIGMGTGVTSGHTSLYPEIETLGIAEIAPSVIKALPYFSDFTFQLEQDPRLEIYQTDGLRFLRGNERTWDIIISEPSNLYVAGVDQLFTREFYSIVKKRLAPDGMLLQWLQAYGNSPEGFSGIVTAILLSGFENIYIFKGSGDMDMLILVTQKPLDRNALVRARNRIEALPQVKKALEAIDIDSVEDLIDDLTPAPLTLALTNADIEPESRKAPRAAYHCIRGLYYGTNIKQSLANADKIEISTKLDEIYKANFASGSPKPILQEAFRAIVEEGARKKETTEAGE